MAHKINSNCNLCDACRLQCPRNAISIAEKGTIYEIDKNLCNDCVNLSAVRCVPHCPVDAITPA
jgi:ferredoxin